MNPLVSYFLGGSLGVLLQILLKIQQLKKQSKIANHIFSFKEYFSDDWISILTSFVSVGVAIYTMDELINAKPQLAEYIKWFFIFVGFSGSSLIQSVLSVTARKIDSIIDIKTNIADDIHPAVDASNIEGQKEIVKDEKQVSDEINKTK